MTKHNSEIAFSFNLNLYCHIIGTDRKLVNCTSFQNNSQRNTVCKCQVETYNSGSYDNEVNIVDMFCCFVV